MSPVRTGRAFHPNGLPDYFAWSTEALNADLREMIDAIRSQQFDNPAIEDALRRATERLNDAAVDFTNALYRSLK